MEDRLLSAKVAAIEGDKDTARRVTPGPVAGTFFELAGPYGDLVFDGGTTTREVTAGDFTKTVELQFLGNWFINEPEKYREPSRAVHVLDVIHGWFGEKGKMGAGSPP